MGNEQGRPELSDPSDDAAAAGILNNWQSLNMDQYLTEQQLRGLFRETAQPIQASIRALEQELTKLGTRMNVIDDEIEYLKMTGTRVLSRAEIKQARKDPDNRLPYFSGNPAEWQCFRANYETTTAACGYGDEENLIRLQRSLKGPALETVRGLLMYPKLVPKMMQTLDKIYGNPELLYVWHLKKIRALENPTPEKMSTCVAFANALDQMCDLLEATNMKHHLQDISLINEFLLKMPAPQITEWNGKDWHHDTVTLRNFCDFVQEKCAEAREAYPKEYNAVLEKALPKSTPTENDDSSAAEQKKETTTATGKPKTRCRMCRSFHPLWHCPDFIRLNVEGRVALVALWKICKICLCDHTKQDIMKCTSRIRCNVNHCWGRHNSLLHPAEENENESENDAENPTAPEPAEQTE